MTSNITKRKKENCESSKNFSLSETSPCGIDAAWFIESMDRETSTMAIHHTAAKKKRHCEVRKSWTKN